MTQYKEIVIIYEHKGLTILRKTPKADLPIVVYSSNDSQKIPPHIADLWLNHGVIKVVDADEETLEYTF